MLKFDILLSNLISYWKLIAIILLIYFLIILHFFWSLLYIILHFLIELIFDFDNLISTIFVLDWLCPADDCGELLNLLFVIFVGWVFQIWICCFIIKSHFIELWFRGFKWCIWLVWRFLQESFRSWVNEIGCTSIHTLHYIHPCVSLHFCFIFKEFLISFEVLNILWFETVKTNHTILYFHFHLQNRQLL